MAECTVRNSRAEIEFVQLADTDGYVVLVPAVRVENLRARGVPFISVTIPIPGGAAAAPPMPSAGDWLTVTQAAQQHLADVDDTTMTTAKSKISRACDQGALTCSGRGQHRRIEPHSFAAWRLRQREQHLDDAS
jgi:hypothetical protein